MAKPKVVSIRSAVRHDPDEADPFDLSAPALSLELKAGLVFEDWHKLGRKLANGSRLLNWWIGDWWASGQHLYGERARLAAEGIFGKEFHTIMNAASICRSFHVSRRREALSFSHHAEVAGLSPEDADGLLDKAESEKLSTRELRRQVIRHRVMTGQIAVIENDDPEHTELLRIAQAWNRASTEARRTFLELANESSLKVIDP